MDSSANTVKYWAACILLIRVPLISSAQHSISSFWIAGERYIAFLGAVCMCCFKATSNCAFQLTKWLKFPFSLSPSQLPRNATFRWPRHTIMSIIDRRLLQFAMTFSSYFWLIIELMSFLFFGQQKGSFLPFLWIFGVLLLNCVLGWYLSFHPQHSSSQWSPL